MCVCGGGGCLFYSPYAWACTKFAIWSVFGLCLNLVFQLEGQNLQRDSHFEDKNLQRLPSRLPPAESSQCNLGSTHKYSSLWWILFLYSCIVVKYDPSLSKLPARVEFHHLFCARRINQTLGMVPVDLAHSRNRTVCSYWNTKHDGQALRRQAGWWRMRTDVATLEVTVVAPQRWRSTVPTYLCVCHMRLIIWHNVGSVGLT